MISRYSRAEMLEVWSERQKFDSWLQVEVAVCEQLNREGKIPKRDWKELRSKCEEILSKKSLDPSRIAELEVQTHHDVLAFTTALSEQIGPTARYIHFGLTSSDVVDTALSLTLQKAGSLLQRGINDLLKILKKKALQYRKLPTIGRSHGVFAEPTSFGLKFLGWYSEWLRNFLRLQIALKNLSVGKLSGAVGVEPHWSPEFEVKVLKRLGLGCEPVSTQVIARDRHAEFFTVIGIMGSSLERIAVELRHLQRSEVNEVQEGFQKDQKGSSAMPHKRNPISSENITGCARLLRGFCVSALENIALWHERDISHSSVERVIFPDATLLMDYAIHRLIHVIENLKVNENEVLKNLQTAGSLVYSGHYLLELVSLGVSREQAYHWVQECAFAAQQGDVLGSNQGSFIEFLKAHPEIQPRIPEKRLKELGSLKYQMRNVMGIYDRVLGKNAKNEKTKKSQLSPKKRKSFKTGS